jgi:hypothetical protein
MSQRCFTPGSPINWATPFRNDRLRRFARRPDGRSERSSSRKSDDNKNLVDMYVKCPGSGSKRPRTQNENFFATLATSIMKVQDPDRRNDKSEKTPRTAFTECEDRAKPQ